MGRVFKAQHAAMGRVVALKVLSPNLVKTESARALFAREVEAVSKLSHPNIVTALDANEINERFFLVMELVDGPNLEQLVRQQGPLAIGLACDYILQATKGLQAAHAAGIVHRDIKPANLLVHRPGLSVDVPGLVKITDFGLARLLDPETGQSRGTILGKANTVMGTPDYLSPEQARNQHAVDIRSDLYSLGCTFFFLLTGQPPFSGGTALDKIIRHGLESPPRVSDLCFDVPPEIEAIVQRLLAKHPADRFQTPSELATVLAPFAVSGPIPWAPSSNSSITDVGPTPQGDETAPPDFGEGDEADDLAVLTASVPIEAMLTPPIECVLAAREEEQRLRRRKYLLLTAIVLGNVLLWWLILK
jgi:serine/threonine protein kinase